MMGLIPEVELLFDLSTVAELETGENGVSFSLSSKACWTTDLYPKDGWCCKFDASR
jgi:hypothetical protein